MKEKEWNKFFKGDLQRLENVFYIIVEYFDFKKHEDTLILERDKVKSTIELIDPYDTDDLFSLKTFIGDPTDGEKNLIML